MDVQGKHILILGLAREGLSLARTLASEGAHVTVTDRSADERVQQRAAVLRAVAGGPVRAVLGGDRPDLADHAHALFVSPGVPETNPVYQRALQLGLPVESMTTLFFRRCPGRIVGITGSSGKTTTTSLIGHMLRSAGRDVVVGGNIGDPMLDLLPRIDRETLVVLELSSFQLNALRQSPHVAVVTNISPNHLDRHGSMDAYVEAKRQIVAHQHPGDHAVLNAHDPFEQRFATGQGQVHRFGREIDNGATVRNGIVGWLHGVQWTPMLPVQQVPLLGEHNVENVLAASAAAEILALTPDAVARAIRTYTPAPHRLQPVGERNGVRFVDDSIATSPARTAVALQAIDQPIHLIAGGRDKQVPWDDLARRAVCKLRALYLIGEAAPLIEDAVLAHVDAGTTLQPQAVVRCATLDEAVERAAAGARPGEVVLLSPGCASYDMFHDFEERGDRFARAVEAIHAA